MRKIPLILLASAILSISCINSVFAETEIEFTNKQLYLYPVFSNLPTEYTSESLVNNVVPLDTGESTIKVTFSNADTDDIYFISIYDVTENRYVTDTIGMAIDSDQFTISGLTGGHEYTVKSAALFQEHAVSGTIVTGYTE